MPPARSRAAPGDAVGPSLVRLPGGPCRGFSFPQTEAKPEAWPPVLGQWLLSKGTFGVAMGEAGRVLLSSS